MGNIYSLVASRTHTKPWLILILLWTLSFIIIWPYGEFPVNDDFGFSTPVKWLSENDELRLTYWQSMTLIFQVFLGYLWSELFGFSYFGLRILTAILGGIFIYTCYKICIASGIDKKVAFVIASGFLSFPVWIMSSSTFMTDTPFLAFSTLATCCLATTVYSRNPSVLPYLFGFSFLIMAILIRQIGIAIALGFLLADIYNNGIKPKVLLRSGILFGCCLYLVAEFPALMEHIAPLSSDYSVRTSGLHERLADLLALKLGVFKPMIYAIVEFVLHFGLLLLPIAAIRFAQVIINSRHNVATLFAYIACTALLFGYSVAIHQPVPAGNVMSPHGLGPKLIDPFTAYGTPGMLRWLLTLLAAIAGSTLMVDLIKGIWNRVLLISAGTKNKVNGVFVFIFLSAVISYAPFGIFYGPWFVRYVVFPSLLFIVLITALNPSYQVLINRYTKTILSYFMCSLILSVCLAHDFYSWSRVRYELIDSAREEFNIAAYQLDGGLEYNNLEQLLLNPTQSLTMLAFKQPLARPYKVAKIPMPGYEVLRVENVRQIFPIERNRKIYLLQSTVQLSGIP